MVMALNVQLVMARRRRVSQPKMVLQCSRLFRNGNTSMAAGFQPGEGGEGRACALMHLHVCFPNAGAHLAVGGLPASIRFAVFPRFAADERPHVVASRRRTKNRQSREN
jgi:hypothetical protein